MRKTAIMFAGVVIVCLGGLPLSWHVGPREARADQIKCEMPKEMTGFRGTLVGKVAQVKPPDMWSTSGWIAIGEIKVLGFSQKMPISAEALTVALKDKYENIGAKDKTVKAPDGVKVGDWMIADCYQLEGHLRATRMALYHPGEEEANCYLFVKKVENDGKVSMVLKKMFDDRTVVLPMQKGADGKMVPKADLLIAVNALAQNSLIVVNYDNGLLKSIKVYEAPKRVEFVQKVTQKIEADTTTQPAVLEHTLVGMEVKDNGTSVTILIDPKDKSASAIVTKIGSFKTGQYLLIHSTTDGKVTWLEDVKVDSSQNKSKDATAKP